MKRMITKIAAFALICTMLTGCASGSRRSRDDDDDDTDKTEATEVDKDSLEYLMNQADNKKQLDGQIDSLMSNPTYKDMFKKIEWKAEGNDLTYAYYYAQEFSDDQLAQVKSNLEAKGDTLKKTVENLKSQIEKSVGIRPDSITYVYYDAADKEIAKLSY